MELTLGITAIISLFILIILRIPIALAMIIIASLGITIISDISILLFQLNNLARGLFSNYDLSIIPMFILMGHFASRSGLSEDIFEGAYVWLSRFKGGMCYATIMACAGFGAISGSSLATSSTMAKVALPQLQKFGYAPSLATGTLAAGGTLGILIPPSIVLIIYAIIVETNVITLFIAALLPALLAIILFFVTITIIILSKPHLAPKGERVKLQRFLKGNLKLLPALIIFFMVIGGIYFGFYTPVPAAAIGTLLVLAYGILLESFSASNKGYRGLNFKKIKLSILDCAKTTSMIYLILLGSELLKIFFARSGLPQFCTEYILTLSLNPYLILFIILLGLIILGFFLDSLSMIILFIPFMWPVISSLEFALNPEDLKIWFGILALITVELGLITPPVGLNVFTIHSIAKHIPIYKIFKGAMPFFLIELVRIIILILFPGIILFLPNTL